MKRKYPTLDVLRIMQEWDSDIWKAFLNKAYEERDLEVLKKTLYGLQSGMDMASQKMELPDKVVQIFLKLTRSIEQTAKKILRKKHPSRFHVQDPKTALMTSSPEDIRKEMEEKRKRDVEFTNFLRDARF